MRAYVFIDAENHFLRFEKYAENRLGRGCGALLAKRVGSHPMAVSRIPSKLPVISYKPELQVFWDSELLTMAVGRGHQLEVDFRRLVHVGSCSGDSDAVHNVRKEVRGLGFEPIIVPERKKQKNAREHSRDNYSLIEKPKGCDIALATRMVSDAAADLYDCCFLFTSDADFVPAIEAIRSMGKVVWVLGFGSALSARSPYDYVPDRFVNLEERINSQIDSFQVQGE